MSNTVTYIFNTGGVEWSAEELEAVFTNGDSIHQWNDNEADRYNGEGWEGWGELTWGDHYVRIDGVDHKIEIVDQHESRDWQYDAFVVFTLEGRFFRIDGEFRSHHGTDWEQLREVSRQTKTVEVYE